MTRNVRLITLAVIVGIGVLAVIARNGRAQATADAQASQVNGKIAADQQFGDPFIINKDGSGKDFLGLSGSTACQFWSPDGRKLACNVFSDNGPMPATVRRDGSHFRYLNAGLPLDFFCMYWSPNGRRLLCHSEGIQNPADAGFYTARSSDAGGRVRITTTRNGLYDLAYGFSPDGRRILFGRFDFTTNTGTLYVVNRDGSHQVRLSPPRWRVIDLTFFDQVGADWSRNGSRVTFAAINQSKQGSPSRLFVVDADGGNLRAVGPRRLNAISAQWSPSRRLITFTSCCASNQVWVVRANGTKRRKVVSSKHGADFMAPVWSPNGKKLLFDKKASGGKYGLWTVRLDGSRLRRLTRVKGFTHYAWGSR